MGIILTILVLLLLTLSLLIDIKNKDERFWAFVIFFQHIPLIIFDQLGNEFIGMGYFVLMIILFLIRSPKLILKKSRLRNPITISIVLIIVSLLIHYFVIGIEPGNTRGQETFYRVFIFNVPIILLCLFTITSDDEMLSGLMNGIILYGLFFIITVLFVSGLAEIGVAERGDFRDDFRISPLAAAKSAGIIIIATFFKLIGEDKFEKRFVYLSVMILSFSLLFITASRAALLFLVITMALYYSFSGEKLYKKVTIVTVSTFFIIILFTIIVQLNLPVIQRLQELQNYEQMLRYTRLELAFEMVKNFEMGWLGLGPYGFGYLTGLSYPHNHIAELIVDYGVLGIISAILLICFGFYYSLTLMASKDQYTHAFIGALFVYLFLATMTSGDVLSSRHMQFTGILLANFLFYKKYNDN